jgi:hypothetical protein
MPNTANERKMLDTTGLENGEDRDTRRETKWRECLGCRLGFGVEQAAWTIDNLREPTLR